MEYSEDMELYGWHEEKTLVDFWNIRRAQLMREDYYLEEWDYS